MMKKKKAIILGGSRGIGSHISKELSKLNINLIKCSSKDIDTSNLENITCPNGLSGLTNTLSNSPSTIILSKLTNCEKIRLVNPKANACSEYKKIISPTDQPFISWKRFSSINNNPNCPAQNVNIANIQNRKLALYSILAFMDVVNSIR